MAETGYPDTLIVSDMLMTIAQKRSYDTLSDMLMSLPKRGAGRWAARISAENPGKPNKIAKNPAELY